MEQFEFNAPRFNNFNSCSESDEEIEKYFDVDHDCNESHSPRKVTSHSSDLETKREVNGNCGDYEGTCKTPARLLATAKTPKKTPRRSECELLLQFHQLTIATPGKHHAMETRLDSVRYNPPLELRSRKISRVSVLPDEYIHEKVVRKRKRSSQNREPGKYMCMAEAVERFHKQTPARFHTKPRNVTFGGKVKPIVRQRCTIPVSPHLKVIHRSRPNHALSRKQLEDLEVEEMKKHQIKARPINENIFKPPSMDLSHRSHHVTEVKPFNLTEFRKKIEEPRPPVVKFTARPVPKGLFKKTDVKNISAPNLTSFHMERCTRVRVPVVKEKENQVYSKPIRKGPITTAPFSFYERDMMLLKNKTEKIKQQLEEEKKLHEFHANPLPKFTEKPFQEKPTMVPTIQQPFRLSAEDKGRANKEKWEKKIEEEKMLMKKAAEFKARPPVVLSKKPFVPLKVEHMCKPLDVQLSTEIRAKERALFDLKMQEKRQELGELWKKKQRELELKEEEEVAQLRKQLVHKPTPIRQYKEMSVNPSDKPLTIPLSPRSFMEKSKPSFSE